LTERTAVIGSVASML